MTRTIPLLLVLTLLTTMSRAEDDAADLFYRAFWMEQARGKSDEAERSSSPSGDTGS